METSFRIVILSSAAPRDIARLSQRINQEVPEAQVCGVLYERRPSKSLRQRIVAFVNNLRGRDFITYAGSRIAVAFLASFASAGTRLLHFVHAGKPEPAVDESLEAIAAVNGFKLFITPDCHSPAALAFVQSLDADLGIVYGARILKPQLFKIPRLGSINIHKRKVPDYRGGGPVGLWEMLDGQKEIGVTVHEVEEQLDAGAVINAATIRIEPYDSLQSLALKAHVVANDLIVRSVADYARGTVQPKPQQGESRMFKNPRPQQLALYKKQLESQRRRFQPVRGRSTIKLLARTIGGLPFAAIRNWRRRARRQFPLMILFHHVITDRPHSHGIPTDHFVKHVEFLRKYYRIVSLSNAIEMLRTNSVTAPTVVLTFDDGYGDNYLTLRAIRESMDIPMTLFVSTQHVESGAPFANDIGREGTEFKPLTWEQLKQMHAEGFEIGSHTRTHFDCGSRNVAALHNEIAGSRDDLEKHVGKPVNYFSFPLGHPENMSPEALELASKTYPYVFSAYGGANFPLKNGTGKHLRRWAHVSDLWELELSLQEFLEFVKPAVEVLPTLIERELKPSTT
ncbi:MAG: polysaccharide deacetylase family protein [Acidobacteria bacterium]|nr:polysaccharide deacetylase family protein [Acidobacteriota bacterium]